MTYDAWIILTGSLVGITCAMIGCFLVLRKMAMLADAISHTVLLGIVGGYLVSRSLEGPSMLIGAVVVGLLTALLVQVLSGKGVQADAAIGVVFTSLFAIGVILLSVFAGNIHLDVDHALMGEITFIPWDTMEWNGMDLGPKAVWLLSFVFIINLLIIIFFYKEFKISSFDPEMAVAIGIPVLFIHYLQMGMLSITTVASFDSVGAILVVAMLIVPASTAYLLTDKLISMLFISAGIGVFSAISGYYVATFLNVSIAGAMATVTGVLFAIAFLFSPKHGLLAKKRAQRKLSKVANA
ncbi:MULTISPECIES: metal ABC transporter permease [Metabacillus]|jgi:manganese/zinc/iron transport system permease protein|uniref:Metal ABC transporter permease n=1 Tax=Metabacillus rhizolycopersici TaxID=2875709 RepID=A0ABS7UU92_9BACI|nr:MULTISPECIES: metal ABC transporter permease [Metabacillus]MBZ5751592.1 metal ABC transporter permease [Metabacillus rhizolycopersici]MCM3650866.1 metal ABC transporter permease [Metabacillus litoralis]